MKTADKDWGVLQSNARSYEAASLRKWAIHIRSDLAKGIAALAPMQASLISPGYESLEKWFHLGPHQSLSQPSAEWLSLTETQVMSGLNYFTNELGVGAGQALMRSLSPQFPADDCIRFSCEIEAPIKGSLGRIDFVLKADSGTKSYYTVVEAKLGSSLASNPLKKYRIHVRKKMDAEQDEIDFIILDLGAAAKTTKRLNRNKDWRLLSWFVFLSRLEKELQSRSIHDQEYMQFRRMIWDRI